jgi:DNA (cytosine-5)-methyltransferase 1
MSAPRKPYFAAKLKRLRSGKPPRVLDICGGAGGFSLGFSAAGYDLVGAVETDPVALNTYAQNLHKHISADERSRYAIPRDLNESPSRIAQSLRLGPVSEAVDVLLAGLPCQAFARIGRSKLRSVADDPQAYRTDPRAGLYRRFLKYVRSFQPLAIVLENVPDILNHGGHNVPEEISRKLESWGYTCGYTLLNAANYGVPQLRERLFLIAIHKRVGSGPVFPEPTHHFDVPAGYASSRRFALKHVDIEVSHYIEPPEASAELPPTVSVRDALEDMMPIIRASWPRDKEPRRNITDTTAYFGKASAYGRRMRGWSGFETGALVDAHVVRHTPRDYPLFREMECGEQYPEMHRRAMKRFNAEVERRLALGEHLAAGSKSWLALKASTVPPYDPTKFPNKWRKLEPDLPARTLTAHMGKDTYSHIHYDSDQARTISVREAARLQSFPDGFVFNGSMNAAFRQIGNAVPPLMGRAISETLMKALRASGRKLRAERVNVIKVAA